MAAVEDAALLKANADAEGGGFGEQDVGHGFGVGGSCKDGEDESGTAFFHLHGNAKGVEGSGAEELLLDVGEELRVHVVEIGFEDDDGVG